MAAELGSIKPWLAWDSEAVGVFLPLDYYKEGHPLVEE